MLFWHGASKKMHLPFNFRDTNNSKNKKQLVKRLGRCASVSVCFTTNNQQGA